eukprot:UN07228
MHISGLYYELVCYTTFTNASIFNVHAYFSYVQKSNYYCGLITKQYSIDQVSIFKNNKQIGYILNLMLLFNYIIISNLGKFTSPYFKKYTVLCFSI